MPRKRVLALSLIALRAWAQSPSTDPGPAIRPLGRKLAGARADIGSILGINALSDGRVVVNDTANQRVLMLDSSLGSARTILDNQGATSRAYGNQSGRLGPFVADSTVYLDGVASAFVILAPNGSIARIAAMAFSRQIVTALMLHPKFDGSGDVFIEAASTRGGVVMPRADGEAGPAGIQSHSISRIQIGQVQVAGAGSITIPIVRIVETGDTTPRLVHWAPLIDPLAFVDDWTPVQGGTNAIIRASDYHIDWVGADGITKASPLLSHNWRRLTDDEKAAIVDSARQYAKAHPLVIPPAFSPDDKVHTFVNHVPDADDLADFRPPLWPGALTDRSGNVWIQRPTTSFRNPELEDLGPGRSYDVVDRSGVVIDRVYLPGGTEIVGFGRDVVYLSSSIAPGRVSLARYSIH